MADVAIDTASTLFVRLFALSREAHDARHHEVAFHALSAACHAAEDARSLDELVDVEREAQAQISWIDENVPTHRLATVAAGRRGHPGLFTMLARRAGARARLVVLADQIEGRAAALRIPLLPPLPG